jgi:hypothetical protein
VVRWGWRMAVWRGTYAATILPHPRSCPLGRFIPPVGLRWSLTEASHERADELRQPFFFAARGRPSGMQSGLQLFWRPDM